MHRRTGGNVLQRQRVADQDVRLRAAHDLLSDLQSDGLDDVALLAVRVVDQRDARAAVRIVLDRRNGARNPELVALEVDQAKLLLVAAALVTHGQSAGAVTAAGALLDCQQRLVRLVRRQIVVDELRLEAESRGNRSK